MDIGSQGGLKAINLAARFFLELAALAAFGYWGFTAGQGPVLKIVLGLGAPTLVAVLWGMFVAPKAPRRLADPARLALEVAIFGMATLALVTEGLMTLALVFAVAVTVSLILMFAWGQRGA
jgi:hypothetical protein